MGEAQKQESLTSLGTSNYSDDEDHQKDGDDDSDNQNDTQKKEGDTKKNKMQNPEINDLHLIWEKEMIMMICSNAREYMVFDEDNPEESTLLRRVSGAHQEEITILAYDYHLSLWI